MLAPDANKFSDPPGQIPVEDGFTVTLGFVKTDRLYIAVSLQPAKSVATTVYVWEEDGDAETIVPLVLLKPVEGLHS